MDNLPGISRRRFIGSGPLSVAAGFSIVAPWSVRGAPASSQVTFGLIGSGARGTCLAGTVRNDPRARVVALCDVAEHCLAAAAARLDLRRPAVFRDFGRLLAAPSIDAVIIAAPPREHPRILEAAVESGKHVYLETPVAAGPEGCRRVIRAARRAGPGQCVSAGFQRRYSPAYLEARERIRSGRIGTLTGVRGFRFSDCPGGLLAGEACHGFDVLHWFLGAPLRAAGLGGPRQALDHLSLTFEFHGGLLANYDSARSVPAGFRSVGEEFTGTSGIVRTSPAGMLHTEALVDFIGRTVSGRAENTAERSAISTLIAILGRLAIRENRVVAWKEFGSLD